jgi:uncharacterized membrane protein
MEDVFWSLFALLLVAAPVIALVLTIRRTRALEREVWDMRRRVLALERTSSTVAPAQPSVITPSEPVREQAVWYKPVPEPKSTIPQTTLPRPQAQTQASAPKLPIARAREWETFIGGRVFNRIGAAAIIIGIGFFLKYAFDNNLISPFVRVLIGVVAGFGILVGAEVARKRALTIFSQGLVGAGIGVLYLSVYAAYQFYHLVSMPVAFGGMIAVTAIGFVLALRWNELAITLLAWFGGFLTPLLLHDVNPNPVGLLSYLSFLSVGMLALVLMREVWFVLKPLSFFATYAIAFAWYLQQYSMLQHFGFTVFFAVLYWAMFFGVDAYRSLTGRSRNDTSWQRVDSFLNSAVSYSALYALIDEAYPAWMPVCSILFGGAYFLVAQAVRIRQPDFAFAFMRYTLTAMLQMVFATAQAFDDGVTAAIWAVEVAFLIWAGARWKHDFVIFFANVLAVVAFGSFVQWTAGWADGTEQWKRSFAIWNLAQMLTTAVGLFAAAWLYAKPHSDRPESVPYSLVCYVRNLCCVRAYDASGIDNCIQSRIYRSIWWLQHRAFSYICSFCNALHPTLYERGVAGTLAHVA